MILAFDTSGAYCAAIVLSGDQVVAMRVEEMARGQAERLMPLLQEVMTEAKTDWQDLDKIAVGTGPGNFTGIRISVSAARGLALGLGIPSFGVSTLDALATLYPDSPVAVAAPRDMAYVKTANADPVFVAQTQFPNTKYSDDPARLVETIARIARTRKGTERPKPLYIKPADAAPARDAAPVILT